MELLAAKIVERRSKLLRAVPFLIMSPFPLFELSVKEIPLFKEFPKSGLQELLMPQDPSIGSSRATRRAVHVASITESRSARSHATGDDDPMARVARCLQVSGESDDVRFVLRQRTEGLEPDAGVATRNQNCAA